MTKEKKKEEEKATAETAPVESDAVTPPADNAPVKPPPEMTRVQFIGGTAGSIRDPEDGTVLVRHVEPGDVLEPDSAQARRALLNTGHFELTRRRATTDPTTDPTTDALLSAVTEESA
ncbi:hypothetical protein [Deinococcus arenicola]|uniref:Uncharacterized protein n=1 Tax=Deinococcus arenicola TaxID=2994950 RepID=A0ABU4DUX8_9DEIO|nr:hypothetical protein [Deinococcus sp. ZS9-10]MDV6376246.1 hypothetical protein [Deinococcus sp. ZS9-10]